MADLRKVPFVATADRIPALDDVLDLVAGRSTLVIEIKSRFGERQRDLVEAVAAKLARYDGPVAVMSFDPRMVADFAVAAPGLARGIVADDAKDPHDYGALDAAARADLAALAHRPWSGFQFVGYWVDLLPNAVSRRVREDWGLPLLTWTVRDAAARARASAHADQMIFEGFDPEA